MVTTKRTPLTTTRVCRYHLASYVAYYEGQFNAGDTILVTHEVEECEGCISLVRAAREDQRRYQGGR